LRHAGRIFEELGLLDFLLTLSPASAPAGLPGGALPSRMIGSLSSEAVSSTALTSSK